MLEPRTRKQHQHFNSKQALCERAVTAAWSEVHGGEVKIIVKCGNKAINDVADIKHLSNKGSAAYLYCSLKKNNIFPNAAVSSYFQNSLDHT